MTWAEWEQIKTDVARRQSPEATGMRIDGAPDGPPGGSRSTAGGGPGVLRHARQPWTHAAEVASALHTGMGTARRDLDSAGNGVSEGVKGLASLGSLTTVLASWDDRLTAVQNECAALDPSLRAVAKKLGETDQTVGSKASSVPAPTSRKD